MELIEKFVTYLFFHPLAFLAFGCVGAILLLPIGQWIAYKRDCKRYGREQADEINKRW